MNLVIYTVADSIFRLSNQVDVAVSCWFKQLAPLGNGLASTQALETQSYDKAFPGSGWNLK